MADIRITKEEQSLNEALQKLQAQINAMQPYYYQYSGNGSITDFKLPMGWVVQAVYADGLLQKPGASDDYVVQKTNTVETVVFNVAPASINITVVATRKQSW